MNALIIFVLLLVSAEGVASEKTCCSDCQAKVPRHDRVVGGIIIDAESEMLLAEMPQGLRCRRAFVRRSLLMRLTCQVDWVKE